MVPVDLGGRAALRHLKPLKPAEGSRSLPGGSIPTVFLLPAPALMFSTKSLLNCSCSLELLELRINAGSTEGKRKPCNVIKRKLPWPLPGK